MADTTNYSDSRRQGTPAQGYPGAFLQFPKKIYDPVYGYVPLTEYEFALTTTPIFQRLHRIQQMGLANLVFPSATHSRFSHSIGVLYLVNRLLDHLINEEECPLSKADVVIARLAALLHDIGHFPFSHAGERAIKRNYRREKTKTFKGESKGEVFPRRQDILKKESIHETISARIVEREIEIRTVLSNRFIDKSELGIGIDDVLNFVSEVIVGNCPPKPYLPDLVHGEVDADRIDYLLRDSFFTGVSYGKIELEPLIKAFTWSKINQTGRLFRIGVKSKSVHIIEHFLLSRYVFSLQVLNHPRISFLDLIVESLLDELIEDDAVPIFAREKLLTLIDDGDSNAWHDIYKGFDGEMFHHFRAIHERADTAFKTGKLDGHDLLFQEDIRRILDAEIPKPILQAKLYNANNEARAEETVESLKRELDKIAGYLCSTLDLWPLSLRVHVNSIKICNPTDSEDFVHVILPGEERECFTVNNARFSERPDTVLRSLKGGWMLIAYVFANNHYPAYNGLSIDTADFDRIIQGFKPALSAYHFVDCIVNDGNTSRLENITNNTKG